METLLCLLIKYWLLSAIVMSLFWGIRSTILFGEKKFWMMSYQFLFNFIGSFAGWFCFVALLTRVQDYLPSFVGFTSGDIVLFFTSLLGLTGHLPQATYGIVQGFAELGKKVADKLIK